MTRALVWRGLVLDSQIPMPVEHVRSCLAGDAGERSKTLTLLVPAIEPHEINPDEAIRRVKQAKSETRQGSKDPRAVCVCGDRAGAHFYAKRSSGAGVVLSATVERARLIVDGRDFLYTAIPALCSAPSQSVEPYLAILRDAFSVTIESYIKAGRAIASDRDLLIRLTDYIVTDRRIIEGQLHSRVNIHGRYNTVFRSAFIVRGGIAEPDVVDVSLADDVDLGVDHSPKGTLRLDDLMEACERR